MVRPVERGGPEGRGTWSLVQLAAAAEVTRGVARAAVTRGYLPTSGYTRSDIVLLRVAAACMAFPDPDHPLPPKHDPASRRPTPRDADALRFARGILADPRHSAGACLLLSGAQVTAVDDVSDLPAAVARLGTSVVILLPLGAWARLSPRQTTLVIPDTRPDTRPEALHVARPLAARRDDLASSHPDGEPW